MPLAPAKAKSLAVRRALIAELVAIGMRNGWIIEFLKNTLGEEITDDLIRHDLRQLPSRPMRASATKAYQNAMKRYFSAARQLRCLQHDRRPKAIEESAHLRRLFVALEIILDFDDLRVTTKALTAMQATLRMPSFPEGIEPWIPRLVMKLQGNDQQTVDWSEVDLDTGLSGDGFLSAIDTGQLPPPNSLEQALELLGRYAAEQVRGNVHGVWSDSDTQRLRTEIALLNQRAQNVLNRRFGMEDEPESLEQIGAVLGIGREGVRQIEVKALNRLRAVLKCWSSSDALETTFEVLHARQIISTRTWNCLQNAGLVYPWELTCISERQMLRGIKNFGPKSLSELRHLLHQNGTYFGRHSSSDDVAAVYGRHGYSLSSLPVSLSPITGKLWIHTPD